MVAVLAALAGQEQTLRSQVAAGVGQHPDAEIYLSQPGLGPILAVRVLAEFANAPGRYADARARKNYSGRAPISKAASAKKVLLTRRARNGRPADTLCQQAFAALQTSPGARRYYDTHRAAGATSSTTPSTTRTSHGSTAQLMPTPPPDALPPWDV
jgi:transposase